MPPLGWAHATLSRRSLLLRALVTVLAACILAACEVADPASTDDLGTPIATDASVPESAPTDTTATPTSALASATPTERADAPKVIRVIDGDTLEVETVDGTIEAVRVVGIDAPEVGRCGFDEAADALARLTLGEPVDLVAGAVDDRDRYARLLRYVDVRGVDAGLELIRGGFAIARYDSRDGYGRHEREDQYVAADAASLPVCDEPLATPTSSSTALLPFVPGPDGVQVFRNCDALREVYPGGVARAGVPGNISAGMLRDFRIEPVFDDALYEANRERDGDDDGAACES